MARFAWGPGAGSSGVVDVGAGCAGRGGAHRVAPARNLRPMALDVSASSAARSAGYGAQTILNAVEVPPRRAQRETQPPVPARARVVWELDGQEILNVDVIGWTSRRVR